MTSESIAFTLLTAVVVLGSAVLLVGVAELGNLFVGIGGAIMVVGILAMAGYVSMLPEPAGDEAEAGH